IGFWNQIIKLLSRKIIPLYVFDGQPPCEKDAVIQYRQKKRISLETKLYKIYDEANKDNDKEKKRLEKSIIHIKKTDIENVKIFFCKLNIPFIDASGEADALCAKLFKEKYIAACLSDDMDMLALGCGRTIKFVNGKVIEFDLRYILTNLELSHEQFVEMCLLFGCDYIKPSFKINNYESYELIKKYGSIENILNNAHHIVINRESEKCKIFIE